MKRYSLIGLLIFFCFILMSCASNRNPNLNVDLTQEFWPTMVDNDPFFWKKGSDRWFWTGEPNGVELTNRNAPYSSAMSTMEVKVPNFTDIQSNGNFLVQIFGTYDRNRVYIYGPNDAVRETKVTMRGHTLYLNQTKSAPRNMHRVIIRIGVKQLHNLIQLGCGRIEGIHIHSGCLYITTAKCARGNIYLSGDMNVKKIISQGAASINIFGANTPVLDIFSCGKGAVNVSGNVGIRYIRHTNCACINIIGANSDSLRINADGSGKIGIRGPVNLKEVRAKSNVKVYITDVNSCYTYAYLCGNASVGLSGRANKLYVDTFGSSTFFGRYLCATDAFTRARDCSHINVASNNKIFASATDNSNVYFFGEPNILSQFVSGRGTVIPIYGAVPNGCGARMCLKGESVSVQNKAMREVRHHAQSKKHVRYRGEG